jgi:hypothetical protein
MSPLAKAWADLSKRASACYRRPQDRSRVVALFFLPKIVVHKEQDGAGAVLKSVTGEKARADEAARGDKFLRIPD